MSASATGAGHEHLAERRELSRHRFDSTQVELGVDTDLAELGFVVPARPRQLEHLLGQLIEVHGGGARHRLHTAEALDTTDHLGAVLGGPLDDLDIAPRVGIRGGLDEQDLQPAENHREEVVEMVRHARGELADGGERLPSHELGLGRAQIVHHALTLSSRLLCLFEQAGVVDGVGDVGEEGGEELEIGSAERARGGWGGARVLLPHEVHDADHTIACAQGHAEEGAAALPGVLDLREARVLLHALYDDGVAKLGDLARDSLPESDLGRVGDLVGQASGGGRA